MTMRAIGFLYLLSTMIITGNAYADPDDDCVGVWSIEMLKDENYTPWHAYMNAPSHPVKLKIKNIRPKRAIFTDNKNRKCTVMYQTDNDNGLVVFRHCLPSSITDAIPTHYKISCNGDILSGKIVSYKDLFKLKGVRIKE